MGTNKSDLLKAKDLREKAEELNREEDALHAVDVDTLSKVGIKTLIHELQVHQIELELQNDELRQIQEELLASQTKYFKLFNLAPVSYLTLDEKGIIVESNLTFCNLLGHSREHIIGKPLTHYILPEDQDIYYMFSKLLRNCDAKQTCELHLVAKSNLQFKARIEATCEQDEDSKEILFHCAIIDYHTPISK